MSQKSSTGSAEAGSAAGARVAGTLAASAGSGGLGQIGQSGANITARLVEDRAWGISSDAVDRSGEGDGSPSQRAGLGVSAELSPTVRARGNNSVGAVSPTITAGMGTNSGSPGQGGKDEMILQVASALQGGGRRGYRVDAEGAAGGHLIAQAVNPSVERYDASVETLIAFDMAQITHPENRANPAAGDPAPPLAGTGQPDVAGVLGDVAHCLRSEGGDASEDGTGRGTPIVAVPVALRGRADGNHIEAGADGDPAYAVRTAEGGSSNPMIASLGLAGDFSAGVDVAQPLRVAKGSASSCVTDTVRSHPRPGSNSNGQVAVEQATVRRLTPKECERLQGFPDDWTAGQSDAARYRQLGNAVAVPVAEWILRRVGQAEDGDL